MKNLLLEATKNYVAKRNKTNLFALKQAIGSAEMHERWAQDDVTLIVEDTGDRSVGIGAGGIKVTFYKGLIEDKESREEMRTHFIDAAKQVDILQFPVRYAYYSDECPECGCIIEDKCANKNCLSNL